MGISEGPPPSTPTTLWPAPRQPAGQSLAFSENKQRRHLTVHTTANKQPKFANSKLSIIPHGRWLNLHMRSILESGPPTSDSKSLGCFLWSQRGRAPPQREARHGQHPREGGCPSLLPWSRTPAERTRERLWGERSGTHSRSQGFIKSLRRASRLSSGLHGLSLTASTFKERITWVSLL